MLKLKLPKESDPRYLPRISEHDDDMSDAEWFECYGTYDIEGIDINVWNTGAYGSGPDEGIRLTGYPMEKNADGLWTTNTDTILFSAVTGFNPEDYDDEWYGFSEDNTPTDLPFEVHVLVNNILKELS